MYLPPEVVIQILSYLTKIDLKVSRLVSNTWSSCASRFLFDNIYISPHRVDLKVFDAITQHPTLSKCVKRLIYDGSKFDMDLSLEGYFRRLCHEHRPYPGKSPFPYNSPDPQVNEFLGMLEYPMQLNGITFDRIRYKCSDFEFVTEGYRMWKELRSRQQEWSKNRNFYRKLHDGLKQLSILESVEISDNWSSWFGAQHDFSTLWRSSGSGSPLFRSWHTFHIRPGISCWHSSFSLPVDQDSDSPAEFRLLTSALSRTQRKIRTFRLNDVSGVPPFAFDTELGPTPRFLKHIQNAYHALESVSLRVAAFGDENTALLFSDLTGLRALLEATPRLKRLKLKLPDDWVEEPITSYFYEQVFPLHGKWADLQDFDIGSLAISAEDLQILLSTRMPRLQHLTISVVKLHDGTWEGMTEWMRRYLHLSSLLIEWGCEPLQQSDGSPFGPLKGDHRYGKAGEYQTKFLADIGKYVVNGGRHPSLPDDKPNSASLEYLLSLPS